MNNSYDTLIDVIAPKKQETVLIFDVQASESGALSILLDFYNQVKKNSDSSIKWIFVLSTPNLDSTDNIIIEKYPWTKKSWILRLFFEYITTRKILKKYRPDHVLSLQNKSVEWYRGRQIVYLHMSIYLSKHRFSPFGDEKKLWVYQNIIGNLVVRSLNKANTIVVQTEWMKELLLKRTRIPETRIIVQKPAINSALITRFDYSEESYCTFFYPAAGYSYKNHWTLLRAFKLAHDKELNGCSLILTLSGDENGYTKKLKEYVIENHLAVKFVGSLSRENVFNHYSRSILVFPSYLESFGLPLLEAKEAGAPIIASDTPFSHEILDGYKMALFFPEMNEEKLCKCMMNIRNIRKWC